MNIKETIMFVCIVVSFSMVILGFSSYNEGRRKAKDRVDYKVVDGSSISCNTEGYDRFAVVFEDEDIYILEPITVDGIDYNVQVTVEKKGILCTYTENIR